MKDFDEIMAGVVAGIAPVVINPSYTAPVRFYWGRNEDVAAFLRVYKDNHFPLIWSVPKADRELDGGVRYQREAELVLCTRETRDLLNTERIAASFNTVLYPLWDSLARAIEVSGNVSVAPDTITFLKFPNYTVNNQHPAPEVWDCLRVTFTADFNPDNNC